MATMPNLDAARLFLNVAQDLMAQPDLAATRERIVSMAVKLTGATSAALVTVTPSAEVRVLATTDPVVAAPLAQITTATSEGPALQAIGARHGVAAVSLPQECRWPEYVQRVMAVSAVRSELAYALQVDGQDFGVLSLHSTEDGYFTDDIRAAAEIYAGHALMALLHAKEHNKVVNLEIGLASNREIGTAIGVVMTSYRVTDQQAFDMLPMASQHGHRKLRDVAAEVVLTGQLPVIEPRPVSVRPAPQRSLTVVA
jgi:transcriptional regulator with GAF, ATPase, and Fis domain